MAGCDVAVPPESRALRRRTCDPTADSANERTALDVQASLLRSDRSWTGEVAERRARTRRLPVRRGCRAAEPRPASGGDRHLLRLELGAREEVAEHERCR